MFGDFKDPKASSSPGARGAIKRGEQFVEQGLQPALEGAQQGLTRIGR